MKKFYLTLLPIAALMLPFTATAYDFMVDGLAYNVNDDGNSVSVTYTEYYSSSNYSGLTVANIPDTVTYNEKTYSVTSIGIYAFDGCTGLTSITIPSSVTLIGGSAFDGCTGLTKVNITDLAAWCNIDFVDCNSNPLNFAHHLFLNNSEITNLVIPNSVGEIKSYAFRGCSGLTTVTIPNSVTTIGNSAFSGCSGLTSVTIGNSVTSIGSEAFSGCSSLTSVTIGNSVTSIGEWAFRGCSGLTKVNITDLAAWCNIDFHKDVYSNPLIFAHHLFLNNSEITNLVIPDSVREIKSYAFYNCSGLTSVTIPNSVTKIGQSAFSGCSGLTSVTIGNSVNSISSGAFFNCTGMRSIKTEILEPQNVTYGTYNGVINIFSGVSTNYCKLFVPKGTLESYQFTAPWNSFLNIVEDGGGTTPLKGDMNDDGIIDVEDVNALINIILKLN